MIFDSPEAVVKAVGQRNEDMELLRTRFETDYNLLKLTPYTAPDSGYEEYTSPRPRNYFDKVLDGLNRAELQIAIKLAEDVKKEEEDAASIGELFLFGALNDIDRQLRNKGEPSLRKSLGWHIAARGWETMRCLVYVPEGEEEVVFDVMPWDPLHTTWENGSRGLVWAAYTRWATAAEVKDEYDIEVSAKLTRIIDVWDRDDNAVVVGNEWGKEPKGHQIGHVPVHISAVGSMPTINRDQTLTQESSLMQDSTMEDRGDSVFTAARKVYEARNKHVSQLMDMHQRAVLGSLKVYSKDGKKGVPTGIHRIWQAIKLNRGNEEEVEPFLMPDPPVSTGPLMSILDQDLEMSTLPYPLSYGGTQDPMSGRALAMLTDATKSNYNPRTEALANGYTWLCEELLTQFADRIKKPATMRGFKGFEEGASYFSQQIEPSQIDKGWFISVQVEPRLPRDQESEILMAIQATTARPGQEALLSMQTAREDILKLRDPHAESQKTLAEMGTAHPKVIEARIVAALRERGEDDAADVIEGMGQQPAGPAPGPEGVPGAPPSPNGRTQIPPEAQQLIRVILKVLEEAGRDDLAAKFVNAVESREAPEPEDAQQIYQILIQAGEDQAAAAFEFAVVPQGPQGPQGPPAPQGPPGPPVPQVRQGPPVPQG
jgi:hypothetical protein